MSRRRPRRLDRDTAEQLLRGAPAGVWAGAGDAQPLAGLLATAAAPGRAGELAGEQAALLAYRSAHLATARQPLSTQPRRRSMIKTAVAKLLTLKVAAVAIAVTAAGGVALAAGNGALPTPFGGNGDKPAATHASAKPAKTTEAGARGNASPSPSLVGLCHAYTAGVNDNPGKALENPAFTALINAAGGKDEVADFCAKILADKSASVHPSGAPENKPSRPAHPTGPPTPEPNR